MNQRTSSWLAVLAMTAALAACGGGDDAAESDNAAAPAPAPAAAPAPAPSPDTGPVGTGVFSSQQTALNVIGQTSFFSQNFGTSGTTVTNMGGVAVGPDGKLYVADRSNDRILVFGAVPTVNGATASFALGAPDLVTDGDLNGPSNINIRDGRMAVALTSDSRVAIYNTAPQAAGAQPDVFLGSQNDAGCTATKLDRPTEAAFAPGGKFVVSDSDNHRVLIWNAVPAAGQAPDLVIGQNSLTTCAPNDDAQAGTEGAAPSARTLHTPGGVWTDGTRLIVADENNNRVLIWNTFPTASFQPADVVLGQADFSGKDWGVSSQRFNTPAAIDWNGKYLAIADAGNHRVLLWEGIPAANSAPAAIVLGQPDFTTDTAPALPNTTSLAAPRALKFHGDTLFVSEFGANRVSIFKAVN